MRTCMLELERVRSSSVFSLLCQLQAKVSCVFLIKEMLFSKVLFKRLKHNYVQRTGFSEGKSDRACFNSRLVN